MSAKLLIELSCVVDFPESQIIAYWSIHFVDIVRNTMDEEYDVIVLGTGLKVIECLRLSWPRLHEFLLTEGTIAEALYFVVYQMIFSHALFSTMFQFMSANNGVDLYLSAYLIEQ